MRRRRDGERANNSSRVEGAKEAFGIWRRWGWRQVESGGDDDGGGVVVVGGGGGDGVNVGGVGVVVTMLVVGVVVVLGALAKVMLDWCWCN